ncbi:MAG TPA: AMP-binding protein [Solirubrobacteraceae bacterium]|nr:AMP-binding protein [Solirubrobacteraceae bacterium]
MISSVIADKLHLAYQFARAGVLKPSRPDRTLRAALGLHHWGPTLAAGYLGAAARYPDAAAVIDELGTVTFAEIESDTNAIARGLAGFGVREGDGVAVMCRNHRWFIEGTVACSKLGANAVYMNTSFAGPQVSDVIEREAPIALIYDQEFESVIGEAASGRLSVLAWRDRPSGGAHPTLQEFAVTRARGPVMPPSEPGRTVILTSGTTGSPKGANRANPSSMAPAAALLSAIPLHAREKTVIAAPLFHSWGFAHMALGTALASTLVLRRRFDPVDTLHAIAENEATALIVVPVMLQRILDLGPDVIRSIDTSSLKVIAASGSALPGPLAQRVMDMFGDTLYNLYGSTEVAWASIASPRDLRAAPGTAGRPPRGTVVKILDHDAEPVATGETGTIFVGSEMLFEGYTGGGDKARVGALMSTGDVGHLDSEGRLFVDGRDDEMIVSGGENVFPGEIEDLLAGVPGVAEVSVIGVSDDEFGQRLHAYAVLDAGATVSEDDLKDHVRAHLARFKVPRAITFVSELPRNATGKVLKRELTARHADQRLGSRPA